MSNLFKDAVVWLIIKRRERARNAKWRERDIYVAPGTYVHPNTTIGQRTRINHPSYIDECHIGAFCAIGGRLVVRGSNHETRFLNMQSWSQRNVIKSSVAVAGHKQRDVRIGNGVWIGDSVVILPNVVIGDGAVIGAGSIVTRDVPPYAIAVGNPARVIKMRFPESVVALLSTVSWWNWSDATIQANSWLFERDLQSLNNAELADLETRLAALKNA